MKYVISVLSIAVVLFSIGCSSTPTTPITTDDTVNKPLWPLSIGSSWTFTSGKRWSIDSIATGLIRYGSIVSMTGVSTDRSLMISYDSSGYWERGDETMLLINTKLNVGEEWMFAISDAPRGRVERVDFEITLRGVTYKHCYQYYVFGDEAKGEYFRWTFAKGVGPILIDSPSAEAFPLWTDTLVSYTIGS